MTYSNSAGSTSMTFDYVLIAIPYAALRHVNVSPPFSQAKSSAIRQCNYVPATKVILTYKPRFWETPNPLVPPQYNSQGIRPGKGGSTFTSSPVRSVYYPTNVSQTNGRGALLAEYSWGSEAAMWAAMTEHDRLDQVKGTLHLQKGLSNPC